MKLVPWTVINGQSLCSVGLVYHEGEERVVVVEEEGGKMEWDEEKDEKRKPSAIRPHAVAVIKRIDLLLFVLCRVEGWGNKGLLSIE
jgi:hypothetical protein